jgi:hypothetical protein
LRPGDQFLVEDAALETGVEDADEAIGHLA